jgi:RNA polymerase sigma factor (sigma-70 family)
MSSKSGAPGVADVSPREMNGSLLEDFARRYTPALHRFFARRVQNKSDVPDLVQDVFLRLTSLEDLSGIEKPEQYLFATASSALRDRARRDLVREQQKHDPFDEFALAGSDLTPEHVYEGRQAVQRLHGLISELPQRTRDVFVLRVFEGLKVADIARLLGISQRAVEKHLARAVIQASDSLKDYRNV